jgi:hypothetical protein
MNAYDFIKLCNQNPTDFTYFLFSGFTNYPIGSPELYRVFKENVVDNRFVNPDSLRRATLLFEKAQRIRHTLVKKARRSRNTYLRDRSFTNTDLSLAPIETHPLKHRIVLSNSDRPYEFFIGDLLKHWRSQLLNQEWRRAIPIFPTNPYTNEKVTALQFIRVYCIACRVGFVLHDVLTMLFKAGGDLNTVKTLGAVIFHDWAVHNYPSEGDVDDLYEELKIIKAYPQAPLTNVTLIDDPPYNVKHKIVTRLRPVLVAYSAWAYSLNPAAAAVLAHRFVCVTVAVNDNLEGEQYGRIIRSRANGRWHARWIV